MKRFVCLIAAAAAALTAFSQNGHLPRLSPRPRTVEGVAAPVMTLNGTWTFRTETLPSAPIEVPGEWTMQGFEVGEGETAVYTRTFRLPDDWQGKRSSSVSTVSARTPPSVSTTASSANMKAVWPRSNSTSPTPSNREPTR